ncbi:chemotaxis protein [Fictibacillus phosphorivorans]|uniref:chemotaxis protein n=1 Tax=Fictibacillus phosphorivorans TaxID=1221500 RepID=UPI00203C76DA|nr:chemotaxis protein [Fictibacillus phosphorivorans]MCM3719348.1 chemotaxis protein [Fictibacillus phosphorivorans]MCM3776969.1 chemotaxis protein [Fictibacillus phosphorivorans]
MTKKIAVVVLHGIGDQKEDFSDVFSEDLTKRFSQNLKPYLSAPEVELVIQPIYWGSVFNERENEMWQKLSNAAELDFAKLRHFVIHFFGDAIAYQPSPHHNPNYLKVHEVYAKGLQKLSEKAGKDAPLFVIAHSLGTVITSNYFYDLQYIPDRISENVKESMSDTPLEQGETLTGFYSLGSPLALWSLRYADFDVPIHVPSPKLKQYYPSLTGEWINIYDKDDVFGYPLKPLNTAYDQAVVSDIEMNSGNLISSWSPLSHMHYFTTTEVINTLGDDLADVWKQINLKNS